MTLLYILRVSFIFISSAFFFSCTCPEDKIREDMKMKESAFLSSNFDYHIVKSSVYIYKVGENTNFLANDKIQEIASNYALNKGEANRSRQKANMQRNSTTFDNDFNPNWSEIARNEDNKANISDSIANTYKVKLQNINYSNISTPIGGIWVFLELSIKNICTNVSQVHLLKDFCIYIQTMEKRKHILLKFILTISLLAVVRIMYHYSIPKNRGNAWAAAIRKMHAPTTIIIFFLKSY